MKVKNNNGITLVTLVVTIIILIILAGVSINLLLGQNGIITKAKKGTEKYKEEAIREKIELALSDIRTEAFLDNIDLTVEYALIKLEEKGILEEINQEEKTGISEEYIITLGYDEKGNVIILEIESDKSTRIQVRILTPNYTKGKVEIQISAKIKEEAVSELIIPEGMIKKIGTEDVYEVEQNGTYLVQAVLESGRIIKKEVVITKIDNTPPTLNTVTVTADRLKIKISATGSDSQSGIKQFNYTISPSDGLSQDSGTFIQEQTVEITSTEEGTYTVSITAQDNLDNISEEKTETVTTINALTLKEAKEKVNASTLQQYIGTKVAYKPDDTASWRVFYYDETGEFGTKNTLYLKRDFVSNNINLSGHINHISSDDGEIMRQINPKWAMSDNSEINLVNERCAAWLCDPKEWEQYKTSDARYAIGGPSVEMFMKAFNVYKENDINSTLLVNKIGNSNGYSVGVNDSYPYNFRTSSGSIEPGPENIFMGSGTYQWLASPSVKSSISVIFVLGYGDRNYYAYISADSYNVKSMGVCPIVSII